MSRVYRIITSFTSEQSEIGVKQFSDSDIDEIINIVNNTHNYTFKYDGKVCHWREGHLEYNIFFCDEKTIRRLNEFDEKAHNGMEGYTIIDDISEDVLYDRFDMSVFGFFEFEMGFDFFKYREKYLTKDDILDKILKYGKESLSDNDKLVLEDKEMVSPIDNI